MPFLIFVQCQCWAPLIYLSAEYAFFLDFLFNKNKNKKDTPCKIISVSFQQNLELSSLKMFILNMCIIPWEGKQYIYWFSGQ